MEEHKNCLVCERIKMIKNGTNPYFVKELETGYVVIGDHQFFKGYTIFLCKEHTTELHFLPKEFRQKYLEEMSIVAEAVFHAFHPEKLNYELLGNGDTHLHWHIFPRTDGDTPTKGPVWWLPREVMYDDKNRPNTKELQELIHKLKVELDNLMN